MSKDNSEAEISLCASCGIAENDDIKLKKCNGCYLVKYCGIECQKTHRKQHKRECKKRAAELRDELLFKQPESSHLGDCPICCLPLSLDRSKSPAMCCCSKVVCNGCDFANQEREIKGRLPHACPFCRKTKPKTKEEADKLLMKRIEANDPFALRQEGSILLVKGDYGPAFDYLTKAADLGDIDAHYKLGTMYHLGEGVQKDEGKKKYHFEQAAIGGHPEGRHNVGCIECSNFNYERAVKHWIIAATLGYDHSIKPLMHAFKRGHINKDKLESTLRANKAAIDATKSPQRESADQNCTAGIWGLTKF